MWRATLFVFLVATTAHAQESPIPRVVAIHGDEVDVDGYGLVGQGVSFKRSRFLAPIVRNAGSSITVTLPLHERVRVGEPVSIEARAGGGVRVAPPRLGNLLSLSTEVGAFAGADISHTNRPGGAGTQILGRLAAEYRFEFPMAVRATLAHASLAFLQPTNIAALDASAGLSFDTQLAELGLSAGVMTLNDATLPNGASALTFTPLLRLGAIDGVSFIMTVQTFALAGRLSVGGADGAFAFPLVDRYWLLMRFGGSRDGFAHADLALRALVRGNGDHGSVFLLGFAGAAFTYFEQRLEDVIGPGSGLGIEFRP